MVELRSRTENPDLEQACCTKRSDLDFVQMKVEKLLIYEGNERCPICFCSLAHQTVRCKALGREWSSYTTWALEFILCCCLHTRQKACSRFNLLVKTRPADF